MDRRTFLYWVGVGWIASSLPIAIAACADAANSTAEPSGAEATNLTGELLAAGDFQAVGTLSDLDQRGYLLRKRFSAGPLMVIRNPANPQALLAVNPTCPHRQCQVDWKASAGVFECPCHHAKFAPNGSLLRGPATSALGTYAVKRQGDSILVQGS